MNKGFAYFRIFALVFLAAFMMYIYRKEAHTSHGENMIVTDRIAEHPILDVILNRTSNRNMSGAPINQQELMSLFEAARWAPSSYNTQPWRFIYAKKGTDNWKKFFDLLAEPNQRWANNADVLMLLISRKLFEHNQKPSRTHNLDTGSALENMALQATALGLVFHAMEGFDYDQARHVFSIPEEFDIECMIAVGKPDLTNPEKATVRKKISEIAFEGSLKA